MSIAQMTIVECDWCGKEELMRRTSETKALKTYARFALVYKYRKVNPLAEELLLKNNSYVWKHLTFCCEECAENYFKESPDKRPHYVKVV